MSECNKNNRMLVGVDFLKIQNFSIFFFLPLFSLFFFLPTYEKTPNPIVFIVFRASAEGRFFSLHTNSPPSGSFSLNSTHSSKFFSKYPPHLGSVLRLNTTLP